MVTYLSGFVKAVVKRAFIKPGVLVRRRAIYEGEDNACMYRMQAEELQFYEEQEEQS